MPPSAQVPGRRKKGRMLESSAMMLPNVNDLAVIYASHVKCRLCQQAMTVAFLPLSLLVWMHKNRRRKIITEIWVLATLLCASRQSIVTLRTPRTSAITYTRLPPHRSGHCFVRSQHSSPASTDGVCHASRGLGICSSGRHIKACPLYLDRSISLLFFPPPPPPPPP